MFTINDIQHAHSKVKSGADFPAYIQEIKKLGVIAFETLVTDSHTNYLGENNFQTTSDAIYPPIEVSKNVLSKDFEHYLKIHQKGETDYFTFCRHCAETGVYKWIVSLENMTCSYFDQMGNVILTEKIPD